MDGDACDEVEGGESEGTPDDIVQLEQRLAKAQADCEVWRASGQHEKYLEAYCLMEVLELKLERQLRNGRR